MKSFFKEIVNFHLLGGLEKVFSLLSEGEIISSLSKHIFSLWKTFFINWLVFRRSNAEKSKNNFWKIIFLQVNRLWVMLYVWLHTIYFQTIILSFFFSFYVRASWIDDKQWATNGLYQWFVVDDHLWPHSPFSWLAQPHVKNMLRIFCLILLD